MDWIEVAARSVDDAKELALDRLGVVEDELEFEVLEEPRGGLFRRGEARIRARVKPMSREKPGDRRQRRKRSERSSGGGRESKSRQPREGSGASSGGGSRESKPSGSEGSGSNRRRRSRSSGSKSGATAGSANNETKATEADDVNDATLPIDEQAREAARFTEELVAAFGLSGTVTAEVVDDDIECKIEGDNLGVLVGPKGVTLQALEELTRAVLQHVAGGHSARLHLDVSGYRERRRAALAEFAVKIANEVVESGEDRALEPMNAADRKVVHDAASEIEGVVTSSEGEDPRRRVVIRPA